jgi:hypothetical protein
MSSMDRALQTQLENIQKRTGRSLDELFAVVRDSNLTKHGEIRDMLKRDLGMGHGDANTLVHMYFKSAEAGPAPVSTATAADVLDGIYTGAKSDLRPIHDRLMAAIQKLGPFETAPKKGYVSLRRKKQFAMIGPATKTRVEVGLNMKGITPTSRLMSMPPGGMCQYKVNVTAAEQVDDELVGWMRQAYEAAG